MTNIISTIEKIFTQLDKTDFAVIRLILHRQYLTNLCNAFSSAITTRSNNKDYYFAFKAKPFNLEKTYTGFQLISLQKAFENKRISNNLQYYYIIENNNKKIIKLDYIDQLLIIYFISKNSYLKLYNAIDTAKIYKSNVKTYRYTFNPSKEIFGDLKSKSYNENSLLLLEEVANNKLFQSKYNELTKMSTPHLLNSIISEQPII